MRANESAPEKSHSKQRLLTDEPLLWKRKGLFVIVLYSAVSHVERSNAYARLLFVHFTSAFNTTTPHKLLHKWSKWAYLPTDHKKSQGHKEPDMIHHNPKHCEIC